MNLQEALKELEPHDGVIYPQAVRVLIAHAKQPMQVTDEMVEAGAEGIWKKDYPNGGSVYPTFESIPYHDRVLYRNDAKEALQAALNVMGGQEG